MSNGDPTTAPTPAWGDPSSTYPLGPPSAAVPAPPTAPVVPPAFPGVPQAPTGRIPTVSGWSMPPSGPGAPVGPLGPPPPGMAPPGGWHPLGAEPSPPSGSGHGRGRGVAIALLLVFALLAGLAGGFGLARLGSTDGDQSAASGTSRLAPTPTDRSNGSSSLPVDPTFPNGSSGVDQGQSQNGTGTQGSTPTGSIDVGKVDAAVSPGVVNINVLTAEGQGAGTGMILTSDGLVLTNNHVVRGSTRMVVVDADTGDRYDAKVLGTAPTKDVALIKLVGAKGLTTVRTGNSDTVKVGDPVVALGNAGGKGGRPSVVPGNVVALGRSITASDQSGQESQRLSNLIQTDANIVPGDSGGPLANANGEVIAVNSAASVTNQASAQISGQGEGYAIPINDALRIVEQIKAGKASDVVHIGTRGVLGVQVTSNSSDPFGTSGSAQAVVGAAVAGVADGSGAQNAGLVAGSTITALDGRSITSAEALTTALANAKPGDKVSLTWSDPNGQSHTATVTLTAGPPD